MVTKFYMQQDQTAGLQNAKVQPGGKMAAVTKNIKTSKFNIFSRLVYLAKILQVTLMGFRLSELW